MTSNPATPVVVTNHAPSSTTKQAPSPTAAAAVRPKSSPSREQSIQRIRHLISQRDELLREMYLLESMAPLTTSEAIQSFNPRSLPSPSDPGFRDFYRRNDSVLIQEAHRILALQHHSRSTVQKPSATQLPPVDTPTASTTFSSISSSAVPMVPKPPPVMSPLPSIAAPSATEKFTPSHALYSLQLLLERKPLMAMLRTRGHIVTTRDWIQAKTENLTYQLLNELEELKKSEKFSAYQLRRFRDPSRPKSTWDFVLDEAKWMALDYREERKWKITMAYLIGQEVLAYHRHKQNLLSSSNASDGMDIDNYGPPVTNIKFSFDCPVVFYHEAPSSESAEAAYKPLTSSDQYVDPLALYPVVPASRLIQTRFKDRAGQPAIAASLPGTQTYSGPLSPAISTFYSPSYESKSISLSAPAQPKSSSMRPSVMWTSEEDEILLKLSPQFQYNWTVISECVNSNINQVAPRKIPWDCYVRWQHLQSKPSPNLQKSRKDDLRRRAMRHIHFFDGISKVIKKRDAQQKKPSTPTAGGAGSTKSSSSSKPNLTAHLSHQAIASRAGVDPKRWRTPLEQNERRQKLQVTAQQRVQGMLMQQPGGMAAIPGRPAAPRPPGLYNGGMPGMAGQPQQPPPVSGSAPAVPSAGGIAGTPNGGMASIPSPPNASRMAQPNGGPAPSTANAAARMPGAPMGMTQAQVQQLFQRQAMAMQQGQQSGSPPNIPGGLTAAQIAQMPPALAQRMLFARQQQALMQQQHQQQQQQHGPLQQLPQAQQMVGTNAHQQQSARPVLQSQSQPRSPPAGDEDGDDDDDETSQESSPQKTTAASKRRTRRQANE